MSQGLEAVRGRLDRIETLVRGSAGKPQLAPHYRTKQAQRLSEELQDLIQRRDRLRTEGIQTANLDVQILEARRALRAGAPEPAGSSATGDICCSKS